MARKQRSLLAFGFTLLFLSVVAVAGGLMAKADGQTWDSEAVVSWYDPTYQTYTIDSEEKLAGIAQLVNEDKDGKIGGFANKIFEVTRDMDLSRAVWVPIGTADKPFRGTLISKGGATFEIRGLNATGSYDYQGLVGHMAGGTVGGFHFVNGAVSVTGVTYDVYAGSAVGKMTGNSTVYNITSEIPVDADGSPFRAYAGGIVGSAEGSVSNSENAGPVTAGHHAFAGGIVGYVDAAGAKIKKVANSAPVTVNAMGGQGMAGGIAGNALGALNMHEDETPISNSGAVTVNGGTVNYAGGIVGRAESAVSFSNLTTSGGQVEIAAPDALGSYAGGLIGSIQSAQANPVFQVTFAHTAPVINNGGSRVFTGGIAGEVASPFTWTESYTNANAITASGSQLVHTGGLIGRIEGVLSFGGQAKNTGAIAVNGKPNEVYTGGLVGFSSSRVLLENAGKEAYANSGSLTVDAGTGVYTGGLTGNRAYARSGGTPVTNAVSTGDITVNGTAKLYTGGFVGIVDKDGADRLISGAAFKNSITVHAEAATPESQIRTGGIVGSMTGGIIEGAAYSGRMLVTGGLNAYTGGIAGTFEEGTLRGSSAEGTAAAYASVTADGTVGGLAGYLNGALENSKVRYTEFTATFAGGVIGGAAGSAQGTVTGITAGDAGYTGYDSVRIQTNIPGSVDGIDRITAGGIVGLNEQALSIADSSSARIAMLTDSGRSHYTFGAIAGTLSETAKAGTAGSPVRVSDIEAVVQAASGTYGGAVGLNRSAELYLQAERVSMRLTADAAAAGGLLGVNEANISPDASSLTASDVTLQAESTAGRIGGLYGVNRGSVPASKAQRITIEESGSTNNAGGIAGLNAGSLSDMHAETVAIHSTGERAEVGGIAGRSEGAADGTLRAKIAAPQLLSGPETLIRAEGEAARIGGVAGSAVQTEILVPVLRVVTPDTVDLVLTGANGQMGGIAGYAGGSIVTGDAKTVNLENVLITASETAVSAKAGGLLGFSDKSRLDSLVGKTVNLLVSGPQSYTGGLAGHHAGSNSAILTQNVITGFSVKVNDKAEGTLAGGFVGLNDARETDPAANPSTAISSIQNSRVVGSVTSTAPNALIGGMAGENRTLIANNSIADKNTVISRGAGSVVGGLAAKNTANAALYYTYSNANLTVEGAGALTGGLVGDNAGRIQGSYVDIDVTSKAAGKQNQSVFLGGLVGRNTGSIEQSYSASKVTADGAYMIVGGLVGEHRDGTIKNSYVAKSVTAGRSGSYAGGFVGRIVNGKVSNSYSAAEVTVLPAAAGSYAGGFAGRYDNASRELLLKSYYIKDESKNINTDLPDFAEGNYRWQNAGARLSTILSDTLSDRKVFPGLSGWDFTTAWKYGSLNAEYKYPEVNRTANTGGDAGSGVNANINWYMRDKDAIQFEIKTEAELAGLAAIVNGSIVGVEPFDFKGRTITVANPIHIQSKQWEPIGASEDLAFEGTFDGGGHLIDGLTVLAVHNYSGLFGVTGELSEIKNVNLEPLSVAGNRYTGTLAGLNLGKVSAVRIHLTDGAKVAGGIVGGVIGRNTGSIESLNLVLDGGGRVEAVYANSVAGGIVGENRSALEKGTFSVTGNDGSVGSTVDHAVIGGAVAVQEGDVTAISMDVVSGYRIAASGEGSIVGGVIGRHISGKVQDLTLSFKDGAVEASGTDSVLGGIIGYSEAGSTLAELKVTADAAGEQLAGGGTIGGIVGVKEGQGTNRFDLENSSVGQIGIKASSAARSVTGGIAGKLQNAAVHKLEAAAVIRGGGETVYAGGIAGQAMDSIIDQAAVKPDITVQGSEGESAAGGAAGLLETTGIHQSFDFGRQAPLYRGVYQVEVKDGSVRLNGAGPKAELAAGGLTGVNRSASVYESKSAADVAANGGRSITAGGITGVSSSGITVSSSFSGGLSAEGSTRYRVGGIAGAAEHGEFHYTKALASGDHTIAVGTSVTLEDTLPFTRAGGFAGTADHTKITHSYSEIPVEVKSSNPDDAIAAGGFAGLLGELDLGEGTIHHAYAAGPVTVSSVSGSYAGGFAGSADHYKISDAYASGSISNTGLDTRTGGFAAVVERAGSIERSYALQAKVEAAGTKSATRSYTGGFAGYNDGSVKEVYAHVGLIGVKAEGSNVYKGALIGYNFRDGKVNGSSYTGPASLAAVGRNAGAAAEAAAVEAYSPLETGDWYYDYETNLTLNSTSASVPVLSEAQLRGEVLLNNAGGLDYYRLYNRTANAIPARGTITLGSDIELRGNWVPFEAFSGEIDGRGHVIRGLRLISEQDGAGFVTENSGVIRNVTFEQPVVSGVKAAGIAAGRNTGTLEAVTVNGMTVTGETEIGGIAGVNSGTINGAAAHGQLTFKGELAGGIAGVNEGQISASVSSVAVSAEQAAGRSVTLGGIAGVNAPAGDIRQSAAYGELRAEAKAAAAGGIAGRNEGKLHAVMYTGRILVSGSDRVQAGGIAGLAAGGSLSGAVGAGEIVASTVGRIIPGRTFFGGIAGQADGTDISGTVYNRQLLKTDTAYYNEAGVRSAGDNAQAAGLTAEGLASGKLPEMLAADEWSAQTGWYPQLKSLQGKDASVLASAAVLRDSKDSINRVRAPFGLSAGSGLVWSVESGAVKLESGKGTLQGEGPAVLAASVNGLTRKLTLAEPAVLFRDQTAVPVLVSGTSPFEKETTVVLAPGEQDGTIFYTLDGSKPDLDSKVYSGPIMINEAAELRAFAAGGEKEPSSELTVRFTKLPASPAPSPTPPPAGGGGGGGGGGVVLLPSPTPKPTPTPAPAVTLEIGKGAVDAPDGKPVPVAVNSKLKLNAPAGKAIYYTIDGTDPTAKSIRYTGEILITKSMTIKAITEGDDRIVSATFTVSPAGYSMKENASEVRYISGYSNGQFKPNAAITRFELIEALAPLLDMEDVTVGHFFTDVKAGQEDLVAFFTSAGIIQGYPNGTFGGEKGLTRAEFAVIVTRILNLDTEGAVKTKLKDVSNHWSAKYVSALIQAGYVQGFPDGTFKPQSQITRAQAVVLINRIIGKKGTAEGTKYTDLKPSHWAYKEITAASE